jgi:hypothetical protein
VTIGQTMHVHIHATDTIGDVHHLFVDFGDGTQPVSWNVEPSCALPQPPRPLPDPAPTTYDNGYDHVFDTPGTYTVTVEVTSTLVCDPRYDESQTLEHASGTVVVTVTAA